MGGVQITLKVLTVENDNDLDVFEIENNGQVILLSGNTATAMAYGLQWYVAFSPPPTISLPTHVLIVQRHTPPQVHEDDRAHANRLG